MEDQMKYINPIINEYSEDPVYAGACGDYNISCAASVHKRGATGACGDYNISCAASVHKRTGNATCGDFNNSCGAKVHKR